LTFSLTQAITKASTDETETFRFDIGTTFWKKILLKFMFL
jgi:outer membrane protein assembly factor BamA